MKEEPRLNPCLLALKKKKKRFLGFAPKFDYWKQKFEFFSSAKIQSPSIVLGLS